MHHGLVCDTDLSGQTFTVFSAAWFLVDHGVNRGDPLAGPAQTCPGDSYQLLPGAEARFLTLSATRDFRIAPGSDTGRAGDPPGLVARYLLMSDDGDMAGLLLFHCAQELVVLPLSAMVPGRSYHLLGIDQDGLEACLAALICPGFAPDTGITLASGRRAAISGLVPGQMVQTSEHGRQPLRWRGSLTLRAAGAFAPVAIAAGTLGNAGQLILGARHRILTGHRLQACQLVDHDRICLQEGGFITYHWLVFDQPEVIFAEDLPVATAQIGGAISHLLPAGFAPGPTDPPHIALAAPAPELRAG